MTLSDLVCSQVPAPNQIQSFSADDIISHVFFWKIEAIRSEFLLISISKSTTLLTPLPIHILLSVGREEGASLCSSKSK